MQVRDGMSKVVLTVGPGHTLREAARLMADRRVGAAVVMDPEADGPGILTERDILMSLGSGDTGSSGSNHRLEPMLENPCRSKEAEDCGQIDPAAENLPGHPRPAPAAARSG